MSGGYGWIGRATRDKNGLLRRNEEEQCEDYTWRGRQSEGGARRGKAELGGAGESGQEKRYLYSCPPLLTDLRSSP